MRQYNDGEYLVTEHDSGAIVRELRPAIPRPATKITRTEFFHRFTEAELDAFYAGKKNSNKLERLLDSIKMADHIDTTDPRTIAGVQALVQAGVITSGRVAEILG